MNATIDPVFVCFRTAFDEMYGDQIERVVVRVWIPISSKRRVSAQSRGHLSNDGAAIKMLYLVLRGSDKNEKNPQKNGPPPGRNSRSCSRNGSAVSRRLL
jgi:hypothetical protein